MRVEYVKRQAPNHKNTNKRDLLFSRIISYVVLIFLGFVVVYPFAIMIISSLTDGGSYSLGYV